MTENFSVLSLEEAKMIIRKQYIPKTRYQLEQNGATVYPLNDKRYIVIPVAGRKAVLFDNEELLKRTLDTIGIPIKEDKLNPFQKYQEQFLDLSNKVDFFLGELHKKTGVIFMINAEKSYLIDLSKKIESEIHQIKVDQLYNDFYVPIGIFCGEVIRSISQAEWKLEKNYSINPYWIPQLYSSDGKQFNLWKPVLDSLIDKKNINIVKWINKSCFQMPKIFPD